VRFLAQVETVSQTIVAALGQSHDENEKTTNSKLRCGADRMFDAQWLDSIQWPAMAITVLAAWLIASQRKFKRNWGFWLFLLSNVLWIVWGLHDNAYALIFLQLCLAALNIRGAVKNTT
jgi:uncharacterized MAPEG superfamily protein